MITTKIVSTTYFSFIVNDLQEYHIVVSTKLKSTSMTIDEIKAISIKDYLGSMSIYPIKNYGYYGMYKSPFRNEHTPSFKVDYNQNLWYDFALDEGGSLIDLVMKLHNCSLVQAIEVVLMAKQK